MTRDTNDIHEGDTMCSFHFCLEENRCRRHQCRNIPYKLTTVPPERKFDLLLSSSPLSFIHLCNWIYNRQGRCVHNQLQAARGPQRLRLLAIALEKVPTLCSCIWQVQITKDLYWGPVLVDPTEHEELLGQDQRSFPSKTFHACSVTDESHVVKLIIRIAEAWKQPWMLWERQV